MDKALYSKLTLFYCLVVFGFLLSCNKEAIDLFSDNEMIKAILKEYNINYSRSLLLSNDLNKFVSTYQKGDLISHDATIQYYNNKLYVVSIVNKNDTGDSGEFSDNCFVRLDIYETLEGGIGKQLRSLVVAKNGSPVHDTYIMGGCGVPNAIIIGNKLHILTSCKLRSDGMWRELHFVYDCENDSLEGPDICSLDGQEMTGLTIKEISSLPLSDDFDAQLSLNASLAVVKINGVDNYYGCLLSANRIATGLILRSTNLVDWVFVKEPFELYAHGNYEAAMSEYEGYLYVAVRQYPQYGTIVIGRYTYEGVFLDKTEIIADDSRPQFFKMNNGLYLVFSRDERTKSFIVRFSGGGLNYEYVAMGWTGRPKCGNYLEFVPRGNIQYYVQTICDNSVNQVAIGVTTAFSE